MFQTANPTLSVRKSILYGPFVYDMCHLPDQSVDRELIFFSRGLPSHFFTRKRGHTIVWAENVRPDYSVCLRKSENVPVIAPAIWIAGMRRADDAGVKI